jgi:hypothetical protein
LFNILLLQEAAVVVGLQVEELEAQAAEAASAPQYLEILIPLTLVTPCLSLEIPTRSLPH